MLLVLSLFGFAPRDQAISPAPPVEHLDLHPFVQGRLSQRPAWTAFQQAWGGEWYVRWDERNGTPRFLGAPGVPAVQASRLAADVAWLAGAELSEFQLAQRVESRGREFLQFTRTWRGAPVEGDEISLVIIGGRIGGVWVRVTPVAGLPAPLPGERVLALPGRGEPVLATVTRSADRVIWRDRASNVVLQYDPRLWATAQVSCEERTVGDDYITAAARQITATDSAGTTDITDDDGLHDLSGALSLLLDGPELRVTDDGASITVSGTDDITMVGGTDLAKPAASVLHHTFVVRDWIEGYWPTLGWLDEVIYADVNQVESGTCNAYYSSGTINFLPGGSCNNLGQIADVIYHEFGHGIHDYVMVSGTFASDVSEGSADFVSTTITGDPNMAPEFYPGSPYLRELDTDKVYPTDIIGESHNDGLIWGSFMWNLRESWIETYGDTEGLEMTDMLFLRTLEQGPQLTDLYEAVLLADDDDGDWSTGTPHDCELIELLEHHGLGPGAIGVVSASFDRIPPQSSSSTSYPLAVALSSLSADCGGDPPVLQAWYTIDDTARPPGAGDTSMSGWTELTLTETDGVYSGDIPRMPANARVQYLTSLTSADGTDIEYSFGDIPQNLDSFWVGDRAELWCDDLEGDTSEWTHGVGTPWMTDSTGTWSDTWVFGTPVGGTYKPEAAYSGVIAAMTGLTDEYPAANTQYLEGPTTTVSGDGLMRLLSFERMLSVEDGFYDQATLFVTTGDSPSGPLWSNPRTEAGTTSLIDEDWTHQDVALEGTLASGSDLTPLWTLQSDAGLEFGGWAIDDPCIVELDDLAGHFRVDDLSAAVAGEAVQLRWSAPWVKPLSSAVLVGKVGSWPTGPEDGEVLATVDAPVWGEEHETLHHRTLVHEPWYYAVFTSGRITGDTDTWFLDVVEGENAVAVVPDGYTDLEIDTSGDSGDSGVPTGEGEGEGEGEPKEGGCSCASDGEPPAGGSLLAAGAMALGVIRLRRPPRRARPHA